MMKCPVCGSGYEDDRQVYCLNDGTPLVRADNNSELTLKFNNSRKQTYISAPTQDLSGVQPTMNQQPPQPSLSAPPPRRKKSVFWILGGVGVLMIFLFIGVLLVVGLIANYKKTGDPLNSNVVKTSPTPVSLTSGGKYEPELKMAINSANNAQSTAYATLDVTLLGNYYSGEALKAYTSDVATLKKSKIFQISTMQKQDFEYFKVNEAATEAEVRVTETWETIVYQLATKKCLLYYPPSPLPQTVYLKKSASGWIVDSTVYETGAKKAPQACPKQK